MAYEWDYAIWGPLCLDSFTEHVFEVHPCCSRTQCFTPLHGLIIFHCVNIPSSVYPLICWWFSPPTFWLLRIVLLWNCVKFWCEHIFSLLLSRYLGVELSDCVASLCLTFEGLPNYFPKQLHHFIFPPAMYEGSNFSISLPAFVIVCLSGYSHARGCEAASRCCFDLRFLADE